MSLQEKFQIITPPTHEDSEGGWKTFDSAREVIGYPGHQNNQKVDDYPATKFNFTPPGMGLDNQLGLNTPQMKLVMSGESDVSKDTNPQAFKNGFTRKEMRGDEDNYTGEHMDHFYGCAVDEDGKEGFAERNNYLDRI